MVNLLKKERVIDTDDMLITHILIFWVYTKQSINLSVNKDFYSLSKTLLVGILSQISPYYWVKVLRTKLPLPVIAYTFIYFIFILKKFISVQDIHTIIHQSIVLHRINYIVCVKNWWCQVASIPDGFVAWHHLNIGIMTLYVKIPSLIEAVKFKVV